jgi:hypothetical protein
MTIEKIVEQALQDGYLTPAMEAEVGRICDTASELSIEEYMALDRLMGALPRTPVQKPGFYFWINPISCMSQRRNRVSRNTEPML